MPTYLIEVDMLLIHKHRSKQRNDYITRVKKQKVVSLVGFLVKNDLKAVPWKWESKVTPLSGGLSNCTCQEIDQSLASHFPLPFMCFNYREGQWCWTAQVWRHLSLSSPSGSPQSPSAFPLCLRGKIQCSLTPQRTWELTSQSSRVIPMFSGKQFCLFQSQPGM